MSEIHYCRNCGCWLPPGSLSFRIRIEMWASADISIDDQKFESEPGQALRDAVKALEVMSSAEVAEAEAEVYEKHEFLLCGNCRRSIHRGLTGQPPV